MSAWREFEKLIGAIQEQIAHDAVVEYDKKIKGKSGRIRQLDVTISKKVSTFDVLIVLECRLYKRRVGMEKVEAFATKLRDINASQGVIVTNSGFTAGAKAVAKQHGITLLSCRDAELADWRAIVGDEAWLTCILFQPESVKASVTYAGTGGILLGPETTLYDENQKAIGTLADLHKVIAPQIPLERCVGEFALDARPEQPLYVRAIDGFRELISLNIEGTVVARQYIINLRLASGHVLEDVAQAQPVVRQVISESWDWRDIWRTQEGKEVNPSELTEMQVNARYLLNLRFNEDELKPYWRVVMTHQPGG